MTIATVAEAAAAMSLGIGGYAFARHFGGGAALESLELANRVLERRMNELKAENVVQAKRIAELEATKDVAHAILPVLDALRRHEERAADRSEATLRVLDLIAGRLGPEGNDE